MLMAQYDITGIRKSLVSSIRKKNRIERTAFLSSVITGIFVSFFAYFLLDYVTDFPWPVRILLTLGILGYFTYWLPRKNKAYFHRVTDIVQMARQVELSADKQMKGGFNSLLVSAVEFAECNIVYGSEALKHRAVQQAHSDAYSPSKLVLHDRKLVKLSLKLLLGFVLIYTSWGLVSHKSMGIFFGRAIGLPLQYPTRTKIVRVVYPDFGAQHKTVKIVVQADGKVPSEGKIAVTYEGESSFSVPLVKGELLNSFEAEVKEPDKSFNFKVRLGDAESRKLYVKINRAPYVVESAITVTPPKYTGQAVKKFPLGNFEALENSGLSISVVTDRKVKSCVLELKDRTDLSTKEFPMAAAQKGFSSDNIPLKGSKSYSIKLADENGIENEDRIYYSASVISDRLPIVKLDRPMHGTYYAPVSRMNWGFKVSDDYGLASASLHYVVTVKNDKGDEKKVKEGDIETGSVTKGSKDAAFSSTVNLIDLKLSPGMIVTFQALAKDVCDFRGKDDMGKSSISTVNIVTPEELRIIIDEERIGLNKMVNDIKDDMKHQIRVLEMMDKKK
ncbi:MAG TPA: hypothetical protein DET40_12460 [Lentisphaeria bacterium]|nr:MAG: hypothetical protein A2X45_00445 [Lentisphaerae bacterium GWF2_50_93]HCE44351.1 hypothetical protein [Lentisphaeria bacterium]